MNRAIFLALMLIVIIAPEAGSAHAEPNTDEVIEQAPRRFHVRAGFDAGGGLPDASVLGRY